MTKPISEMTPEQIEKIRVYRREYARRYRLINPSAQKEASRRWKATHREQDAATHKKYRSENIEKIKAWETKYHKRYRLLNYSRQRARDIENNRKRKTDSNAQANAQVKYRAKNPIKCKAQSMVNNAVKRGKLIRRSCQVCGDPETHAHHPDYSQPLAVQWLCVFHHQAWHRVFTVEGV